MGSSPIKGKIPIAQLVEQLSDKQEVTGSSPVGNKRGEVLRLFRMTVYQGLV
jgi:hypothetical protein